MCYYNSSSVPLLLKSVLNAVAMLGDKQEVLDNSHTQPSPFFPLSLTDMFISFYSCYTILSLIQIFKDAKVGGACFASGWLVGFCLVFKATSFSLR